MAVGESDVILASKAAVLVLFLFLLCVEAKGQS